MAYQDLNHLFPDSHNRIRRNEEINQILKAERDNPPIKKQVIRKTDWEAIYDNIGVYMLAINIIMLIVIYNITPITEPYMDWLMVIVLFCYMTLATLPYIKLITWPILMIPTIILSIFNPPTLISYMSNEVYMIPAIWGTIIIIFGVIGSFIVNGFIIPILNKIGL